MKWPTSLSFSLSVSPSISNTAYEVSERHNICSRVEGVKVGLDETKINM